MVDQMMINLAGKNALGKQELTILDMLQTNNFERPMYYAITVSPDQFVNLTATSNRPVSLIKSFRKMPTKQSTPTKCTTT